MSILSRIQSPNDLKALEPAQLPELAQEIRETIIEVTSANGGHIGPNLGVVELTIALHRIFNTPADKFVFDVSHQCYVHKLLTGRQGEAFKNLRKSNGVCGFLLREESPHDAYGAGHAGTALSAALGMAKARDLKGTDEHVVALIGDAALTCGITMEAMNNVAATTQRLVVILNDNEWSIARNVGAIAKYLNALITQPAYQAFHRTVEDLLERVPWGHKVRKLVAKAKRETKDFLVEAPSGLFESYGLRYVGPIDGHNLEELTSYLEFCKHAEEPVLLHVLTTKGKGYDVALRNPEKFHGTSSFEIATGQSKPAKPGTPPNYQDIFGETLTRLAQQDSRIVGITAAMPSGTGLNILAKQLPEQFFDVGIAEEHAVLFAAGMATQGMKPVCAIYSTFLQRGFDPIVHDVCLQNLPVLFCMDRAGLSPNDGPTHHGLFDLAYLRSIPNTVIMQPKDEDELADMVSTGVKHPGPAFIRYPRGTAMGVTVKPAPATLPIGKAEELREGNDIGMWALGPWVADAMRLAAVLERDHGLSISIVNARFVKPLDAQLLCKQAQTCKMIVTLEDHAEIGGLGSAVIECLRSHHLHLPVEAIGWPDKFIEHGSSVEHLRKNHGLDDATILKRILELWAKGQSQSSVVCDLPTASMAVGAAF